MIFYEHDLYLRESLEPAKIFALWEGHTSYHWLHVVYHLIGWTLTSLAHITL